MEEVFGWFAQENRQKLTELILQYEIKSVLEVGSFLGLSAKWFAERVEVVHCVDKFVEVETQFSHNNLFDTLRQLDMPSNFYAHFVANCAAEIEAGKIVPHVGWSSGMADHVPDCDLVYIDADHSYEGASRDMQLYLPRAKKVFCGDDYQGGGVAQAANAVVPGHSSVAGFWWLII